jgi:hypothetical protein
VRGRVSHYALTNLSSNMMANWVLAAHHSRGGIFHVCATLRKTRYSNLIAASSVGKCPLVRTARRSLAFKDSMAFVTGMRIAGAEVLAAGEEPAAYGATIRDGGAGSTKVWAGRCIR